MGLCTAYNGTYDCWRKSVDLTRTQTLRLIAELQRLVAE